MPAAAASAIQMPTPELALTKPKPLLCDDESVITTESNDSAPQIIAASHAFFSSACVCAPINATATDAAKHKNAKMPQPRKPFMCTLKPKAPAENQGRKTEIMPATAKININLRCLCNV